MSTLLKMNGEDEGGVITDKVRNAGKEAKGVFFSDGGYRVGRRTIGEMRVWLDFLGFIWETGEEEEERRRTFHTTTLPPVQKRERESKVEESHTHLFANQTSFLSIFLHDFINCEIC
ncbi:hypothetical protein L6452_14307 [Arctium lappa]|uniref:Uncharacterized protein n=1 Tax=Arctium lappa TaxID=4217 RepID=A0ACB9CKI6_ARCLA|nr:hypothetical protein L6452_14307 [Arctium lappa]